MKLCKLIDQGGNLMVTIPRDVARELGWLPRQYVSVRRVTAEARSAVVIERRTDDRVPRRPRTNRADR
jgi:hypothetical protein